MRRWCVPHAIADAVSNTGAPNTSANVDANAVADAGAVAVANSNADAGTNTAPLR